MQQGTQVQGKQNKKQHITCAYPSTLNSKGSGETHSS